MAVLSVQNITLGTTDPKGIAPTYAAAASGGDTFTHSGGNIFIHVKNTHTAAWTVTVTHQRDCDHGFGHDVATSVAATNGDRMIPLPKARYANDTDVVSLSYSGVTALTVAVLKYVG